LALIYTGVVQEFHFSELLGCLIIIKDINPDVVCLVTIKPVLLAEVR